MAAERQSKKERMQKVLEAMVNNPNLSNEEICDLVGIGTSTFYRYKQDPDFMAQYHEMCQARFKSLEAKALQQLDKALDRGDFRAVKYALDSLGYKPTEKIEADVNRDVVITIGE